MEAVQYYDQYTLLVQARDPVEIAKSAQDFLEAAIKKQIVSTSVSNAKILPFDAALPIPKDDKKTKKVASDVCKRLLTGFIVAKGNYTKDTYWLYEESSKVFVSFPMLIEVGKHGTIQWALLREISILANKKDTNIVKFLKRANVVVPENKKKYAFAKGCNLLLENAGKESYETAKNDLDIIIASMKEHQGKTSLDVSTLSGLKFFVSVL